MENKDREILLKILKHTVNVSDYIPQKTNKKAIQSALSTLESGIKPSTKKLEDFRAERLSKYEVVN